LHSATGPEAGDDRRSTQVYGKFMANSHLLERFGLRIGRAF